MLYIVKKTNKNKLKKTSKTKQSKTKMYIYIFRKNTLFQAILKRLSFIIDVSNRVRNFNY